MLDSYKNMIYYLITKLFPSSDSDEANISRLDINKIEKLSEIIFSNIHYSFHIELS